MKKALKIILIFLLALLLLIVAFGVYKFNFTDDDIYLENGKKYSESMTLDMKTWVWIKTVYNNDTEIKPKIDNRFSITFRTDNSFSASTDCNNMGGEYTVIGNSITFGKMFSTKMFCPDSQENDFAKMLGEVQSYFFSPQGELVLGLKFDSGSVIFK